MAPGQEANGDSLWKCFRSSTNNSMLRVLIRIASVHATYNLIIIMRKFPTIFVFLSYRKNFIGTQK